MYISLIYYLMYVLKQILTLSCGRQIKQFNELTVNKKSSKKQIFRISSY